MINVLLIGQGAREHALAWKLTQSPLLTNLWIWPGHPMMEPFAKTLKGAPTDVKLNSQDFSSLIKVAKDHEINLVIAGPETPLAGGLADQFALAGIPTFGPIKVAAQLETNKVFAKDLMIESGIPTAKFEVAHNENECRQNSLRIFHEQGGVVLKASGLAAGKGVFVCKQINDIEHALNHLYHTDMHEAASEVVIEEILQGRECSYFAFIGSGHTIDMGFAVDYKRLSEGDIGPNTGGMGCYTPVPWLPGDAAEVVNRTIISPLLKTLDKNKIVYTGCLYVGIMWSPTKGPYVVEFNVRLGDPEAQVLCVQDSRDWLQIIADTCGILPIAPNKAQIEQITQTGQVTVGVVMTSASYPYSKVAAPQGYLPKTIFRHGSGHAQIFAASIMEADSEHVTTGAGRVLTVTAQAPTFEQARALVYQGVTSIEVHWPGAHYRKDIAGNLTN